MAKAKNKVGRPYVLEERDVVFLAGKDAKSKLQTGSDRRAVVNRIVELGGKATIAELNESFGYDIRAIVLALIKIHWLGVEQKSAA